VFFIVSWFREFGAISYIERLVPEMTSYDVEWDIRPYSLTHSQFSKTSITNETSISFIPVSTVQPALSHFVLLQHLNKKLSYR